MKNWKTSQYKKKHQRAVNAEFRAMNKAIAADNLWRGRFVIEQLASWFLPYEDHSGHYLLVSYQFRDKKTGQIKKRWCEANSLLFGVRLFREMNDFIVEDCYDNTWAKPKEYIYDDVVDYTKIK